jgi:hypothetical protein
LYSIYFIASLFFIISYEINRRPASCLFFFSPSPCSSPPRKD